MRISDWSSDVCSSDLTLLLALGRRANTEGFGLQELGVVLRGNDTIQADALLRTNFPNIHVCGDATGPFQRSEEHTSELQSLMRISNAVFCLKNKTIFITVTTHDDIFNQRHLLTQLHHHLLSPHTH